MGYNKNKNKAAFKMAGKSPMIKALVGNQENLPINLQKEIKAAPIPMLAKNAPTKNYKKGYYGA